jgi:cytidylate kinase
MKITIGGQAGVGKGTISRLLAKQYGLALFSVGDVFRMMAQERNMSVHEFHELVEKDILMNLALEEKTKQIGKEYSKLIFEGRLAWYAIPDSIKILLTCSDEVRFKRIASRENSTFEKAKEHTEAREALTTSWYKKLYSIDSCVDPKHFDLVVDTSAIFPHEIIEIITKYIEDKKISATK